MIKTFIQIRKCLLSDDLSEIVIEFLMPEKLTGKDIIVSGAYELIPLLSSTGCMIEMYIHLMLNSHHALAEKVEDSYDSIYRQCLQVSYQREIDSRFFDAVWKGDVVMTKKMIYLGADIKDTIAVEDVWNIGGGGLSVRDETYRYLGEFLTWCLQQEDQQWVKYVCSSVFWGPDVVGN